MKASLQRQMEETETEEKEDSLCGKMTFLSLPDDSLHRIYNLFLPLEELCISLRVCKTLREVLKGAPFDLDTLELFPQSCLWSLHPQPAFSPSLDLNLVMPSLIRGERERAAEVLGWVRSVQRLSVEFPSGWASSPFSGARAHSLSQLQEEAAQVTAVAEQFISRTRQRNDRAIRRASEGVVGSGSDPDGVSVQSAWGELSSIEERLRRAFGRLDAFKSNTLRGPLPLLLQNLSENLKELSVTLSPAYSNGWRTKSILPHAEALVFREVTRLSLDQEAAESLVWNSRCHFPAATDVTLSAATETPRLLSMTPQSSVYTIPSFIQLLIACGFDQQTDTPDLGVLARSAPRTPLPLRPFKVIDRASASGSSDQQRSVRWSFAALAGKGVAVRRLRLGPSEMARSTQLQEIVGLEELCLPFVSPRSSPTGLLDPRGGTWGGASLSGALADFLRALGTHPVRPVPSSPSPPTGGHTPERPTRSSAPVRASPPPEAQQNELNRQPEEGGRVPSVNQPVERERERGGLADSSSDEGSNDRAAEQEHREETIETNQMEREDTPARTPQDGERQRMQEEDTPAIPPRTPVIPPTSRPASSSSTPSSHPSSASSSASPSSPFRVVGGSSGERERKKGSCFKKLHIETVYISKRPVHFADWRQLCVSIANAPESLDVQVDKLHMRSVQPHVLRREPPSDPAWAFLKRVAGPQQQQQQQQEVLPTAEDVEEDDNLGSRGGSEPSTEAPPVPSTAASSRLPSASSSLSSSTNPRVANASSSSSSSSGAATADRNAQGSATRGRYTPRIRTPARPDSATVGPSRAAPAAPRHPIVRCLRTPAERTEDLEGMPGLHYLEWQGIWPREDERIFLSRQPHVHFPCLNTLVLRAPFCPASFPVSMSFPQLKTLKLVAQFGSSEVAVRPSFLPSNPLTSTGTVRPSQGGRERAAREEVRAGGGSRRPGSGCPAAAAVEPPRGGQIPLLCSLERESSSCRGTLLKSLVLSIEEPLGGAEGPSPPPQATADDGGAVTVSREVPLGERAEHVGGLADRLAATVAAHPLLLRSVEFLQVPGMTPNLLRALKSAGASFRSPLPLHTLTLVNFVHNPGSPADGRRRYRQRLEVGVSELVALLRNLPCLRVVRVPFGERLRMETSGTAGAIRGDPVLRERRLRLVFFKRTA
uniref:F-box domain-containing protein n=1 Tax=Chromera velia CCMP2878 TaxID=1169474 RepID=A0A0G4FAC2_9ALVE|eukprot:Cvel_15885.t1-p1 / transcript=Cvel_15885.t1 / gene=Cvel_15885 / organism=Chromera_velia_CCMP2878 / gene_product=hypothetical protein / transcript_product=hypothetical protein / location=Cvel_scaffold1199:7060-13277(-) / protein_length=1165 / sequence_SO=supercontig / SO=protein_coding / is_pseudo=false